MMDKKEMMDKIVAMVKPYVRDEEALANISENTSFLEDLQINSSRLVDIVLSLEDDFDISIEDEEVGDLSTVGSVIELLQKKLG